MAVEPEPEVSAGRTQESLDVAVQLQPVGAVKLMVPDPAALPMLALACCPTL